MNSIRLVYAQKDISLIKPQIKPYMIINNPKNCNLNKTKRFWKNAHKLDQQGKLKRAIKNYTKAFKNSCFYYKNEQLIINSNLYIILICRADAYVRSDKFKLAHLDLDQASLIGIQNDPQYYTFRQQAYYGQQKYKKAWETLKKGIKLCPNNDIYWDLEEQLYSLENDSKVMNSEVFNPSPCWPQSKPSEFKKVQDIKMNIRGQNIKIAEFYQPKSSEKIKLHQEIEENMKKAQFYKVQGNEFYKKKKYQEAIEQYEKAIQYFPHEGFYYSNKAAALIELQKYQEALDTIQQGIYQMQKQSTTVLNKSRKSKLFYRKAKIQLLKGEHQEALKTIKKSKSLCPFKFPQDGVQLMKDLESQIIDMEMFHK